MSLEAKTKELSDKWCVYANHLIHVGNNADALQMRTVLLAEMTTFARPYEDALRELHKNAKDLTDFVTTGEVIPNLNYLKQALSSAEALLEAKNDKD